MVKTKLTVNHSACNEGVIFCSQCGGSGLCYYPLGSQRYYQVCQICKGLGYFECPLCFNDRKSILVDAIFDSIKHVELPDDRKTHLICFFKELLESDSILNRIKNAQQASVFSRLNRHDLYHALHVTHNAVELFNILCSPPDSSPFKTSFSMSDSLEIILLSSFCHDISREFPKHGTFGATQIIDCVKEFYCHLKIPVDDSKVLAIQSCIYYHSGEESLPPHIENIIVTIADGLDCGRHRVQPFFNEAIVLGEDKRPEEYISNMAIDRVEFHGSSTHLIEFIFHLNDLVGIKQAFHLKARLINTLLSQHGNADKFVIKAVSDNWGKFKWKSRIQIVWPNN